MEFQSKILMNILPKWIKKGRVKLILIICQLTYIKHNQINKNNNKMNMKNDLILNIFNYILLRYIQNIYHLNIHLMYYIIFMDFANYKLLM